MLHYNNQKLGTTFNSCVFFLFFFINASCFLSCAGSDHELSFSVGPEEEQKDVLFWWLTQNTLLVLSEVPPGNLTKNTSLDM